MEEDDISMADLVDKIERVEPYLEPVEIEMNFSDDDDEPADDETEEDFQMMDDYQNLSKSTLLGIVKKMKQQ